ncbi:MAG: hypothetical protein A3J06_00305 [Candidatus Moranbacteria bacterium RIFCSPLOWO2_02_FULL_48_19]|nr:MAG: hypothetical protein A3J06_00305 [Candidatus Moranbacteria bacterium RIFCSPLOWO2_02_FULL_48_19]OGI31673.1 MAG: hypothetical protein A3G09_02380 [Candidatus Moranbacteria bacterium RIFCSPLOWO2_12_FULL_48_12]
MYSTLHKHFKKKTLRGFSLGEVLLAVFVLTVGVLSLTALMASSLRQSLESQNAVIAVELAQEGVELVRNVRDNDFAAGNDGFTAFDPGRKHCRADYNDPAVSLDCDAPQGTASRYYLQYSGGLYAHTSTAVSRFYRYIFIDYNNGQKTALVRSFVYWGGTTALPTNGNSSSCTALNKCVFTEVTLTNWK